MMIGILVLGAGALFFAGVGIWASDATQGYAPLLSYLATSLLMSLSVAFLLYRTQLRLRRALGRSHRRQRQLSASSRIDALTGLLNRAVFMRTLDGALERLQAGGPPVAVLLVDLDRFKSVNDTHGHAAGDGVLVEAARRLAAFKESNTTVARLGGDEFAILLEDNSGAIPQRVGRRLIDALAAPIPIANGFVRISASVGLAVSDSKDITGEELLRSADIALYGAKRGARGTLRVFETGMDQSLKDRSILEADLRRAMAEGEIVPYYQPLIALNGDRLIGFEVLARWQHPMRGIIPPTSFIPLAEEIGRIGELFDSLLVRACDDARAWPSDLRLSVNISPTQFAEPQMASRILAILAKADFAPARLELEITENALVDEVSSARLILTTLRNVGISVALDDFGTGYSSLRHLSDLPVDRLKIDRGFVENARRNDEDWRIIRAIVQLASTFDLATTAEGIEAPEMLATLRELGCDIGQGYLFGRPISAEQTGLWLQGRPTVSAMAC